MPKLTPAVTCSDVRRGLFCLKKDTNQPVRTSVKRTFGRVDGYFPSAKNNRMIGWESQVEGRACHYFEFFKPIKKFVEQPVRIKISGPENFTYTPDFKLVSNASTTFVEVKPYSALTDEVLLGRLNKIAQFFNELDCHFVVISDREIPKDIKFRNIKFLLQFISEAVHPEHIRACETLIHTSSPKVLGELLRVRNAPRSIMALLAKKIISTDLSLPITMNSTINLNTEKQNENAFIQCRTAPNFKQCSLHDFIF